jgi:hypothetical protein
MIMRSNMSNDDPGKTAYSTQRAMREAIDSLATAVSCLRPQGNTSQDHDET